MSLDSPEQLAIEGASMSFGIVGARFNQKMVDALIERGMNTLAEHGVLKQNIEILRVPGSNEIPFSCNMLAETGRFDCILGLGVIIAGETSHHDVIAFSTAHAMHQIGIETGIPVINGIITANTEAEAHARTLGAINRGKEFAQAALEMAQHRKYFVQSMENGKESC